MALRRAGDRSCRFACTLDEKISRGTKHSALQRDKLERLIDPVPYRDQGPAMTGLLGGQVQVLFDPIVSSLPNIRGGRLRPLAVTTATRSDVLPDVPSMADFVPGYEASVWFGTSAPRNTPADILDKLNKETNAGLADPALKARLMDLGGIPMPMSPPEFGKFIADETEKWAKVIKFANIKPE